MAIDLERKLPELFQLESLINQARKYAKVKILTKVKTKGLELPLYSLRFGNNNKEMPAIAFVGGVHGLERIGARVVLAYLDTVIQRLEWDKSFKKLLNQINLIFVPIVNPSGMALSRRANVNGIDLMRNAPIESEGRAPFLIAGQRISKHLPYYRGLDNEPMQPENQALVKLIRKELFHRKFCLSIDCHSGFGTSSRVWFPYARSRNAFENLGEMMAIAELFDRTYPNHFYQIEPQSKNYTTHGDLWDYIYLEHLANSRGTYLPLTLEMGSWLWVKKNPRQLFSFLGIFNPMKPHRQMRVLRQNIVFFDFLLKACVNYTQWLPKKVDRERLRLKALRTWFEY